MDILFKNSFTLTEKLILECRVAFISKWDKFFSLLFLFTSLFGFIYSESNLTTKFISIYLMFMCVYLIFILPTLRSKKMYKRYLAINNYEQLHESVNFYNDIFESKERKRKEYSIQRKIRQTILESRSSSRLEEEAEYDDR